jgi:hypothetical protein
MLDGGQAKTHHEAIFEGALLVPIPRDLQRLRRVVSPEIIPGAGKMIEGRPANPRGLAGRGRNNEYRENLGQPKLKKGANAIRHRRCDSNKAK